MLDETTPANQNRSFAELTRNPQREHASGELATVLYQLEQSGIHPQLLAEILFDYAMLEMEPDDPITTATATTWFSQLHRFRDRLQLKIDEIERIYDDKSN